MFGRRSRMGRRPTRSTSVRVPSRGRPTQARRRPVTPGRGRSIGMPPPPPGGRRAPARRPRPTQTRATRPVQGATAKPRQETPRTSSRRPTGAQAAYMKRLLGGARRGTTPTRRPSTPTQQRRSPARNRFNRNLATARSRFNSMRGRRR